MGPSATSAELIQGQTVTLFAACQATGLVYTSTSVGMDETLNSFFEFRHRNFMAPDVRFQPESINYVGNILLKSE